MNHFFICGLPRSRTAWSANLLTYGPSFCHHDALIECASASDLPEVMSRNVPHGTMFLGDSDSNLGLCWREVMPLFPDAKVVIVSRAKDAAIEAEYQACLAEGYKVTKDHILDFVLGIYEGTKRLMLTHPARQVMVASFDELDSYVEPIWNFCLPGVPFCKLRAEMLSDLRVTQVFKKAEKRINPRAGEFLFKSHPKHASILEREPANA